MSCVMIGLNLFCTSSMFMRVSFCVNMNQSRLSSWPTYLSVQVRIDAVERRPLRLVPVIDHQVLAVGVLRGHQQDHRVVENLLHLRRVLGGEPMDDVDDRLAVADLGGVNGRVEEVEGLAFHRQLLRLGLRQPARIGQAAIDLDEPIEVGEVLRRADAQHRVAVPHRRLSQLLGTSRDRSASRWPGSSRGSSDTPRARRRRRS